MKHLPPLFDDRSGVERIIAAIVVPLIFGIITGLALGFNAILYWALAGPLALGGGFLGGMEHRGPEDGFVRGAIGGLIFGSFTLIGLEILDTEPKTYLSEPQVGLVFATTFFGCILGALGGQYRLRREREADAGTATA
jgi:hypothetical protein